jgi:hypothetical protein
MPATPTPVTARSPRLEAPKLRSSCDGCRIAKVKCARGQPKCRRCETFSLTCVYGPSRKMGKPPRKRPGSNRDATIEKRICTSWTAAHSRDIHPAMGFGEPQRVSEPTENNFSNPATDILPFSSGINTASGISEQNQLTSDFYPFLPLEEWPQLGEWHQFDCFGAGPDFTSASPLEPASTVSKSCDESHSCPRESYEIFRDLICPSPSLHAPESNSVTVSAQLDQVLQFNRNATDRLTQVLRCPCAKSGHRAMVHASIVSRILIWYQQAAGWTGSSSWGPQPSGLVASPTSRPVSPSSRPPPRSIIAAGTSTTSPSSLVQTTGFSVEQVPILIGTFSIEDQKVQAAFRNQLVLSELKKTANLIDMFTSQDLGESSSSGVAGLYSHLGTWLRDEHSRTVRTLKSKLSALREDLES